MPVWPLQKDCNTFYGNPGNNQLQWRKWEAENLTDVACPWPLYFYENGRAIPVKSIRIHKKCADSLRTVLNNVWDKVGHDVSAIETLHYNRYSGSYNQRTMRGGSSRSMHGFGAAIDFDAEENAQHATRHLFQADSLLVVEFEAQGWVWGGRWSPGSIDAMHFQAARVR